MKVNRHFVLFAVLALLVAVSAFPLGAQEAITLTVYDVWTRDAEVAMYDALDAEFMAANPGVTVVREAYLFDDLMAILPLALSEDTGPDVAQVNQGYTSMGPVVAAGLILPLDKYADQYGWWDRYATSLHKRNSFSADGKQMGVGNLYALSNTAEVVGVYYFRDIFEENGLGIPQTVDEFEKLLATLAEAGVTPIAFGSADGWPAIHDYSAIQHAYATVEELDNFIFRMKDGTFDTEANLIAAQKLVEWVNAGYFTPGFEGLTYDDTLASFLNKDAAMWITGSWATGNIIPQLGEEAVGFFLFPPSEAGKAPLSIGGVGIPYAIRATTSVPDIAAAYIDYITGPTAAKLLLENGFLPASKVDPDLLTEGTLTADTVLAWDAISSENAVGHYLDWTSQNIAAYLQELMAGVITPEEFVAKVQEDYLAGK